MREHRIAWIVAALFAGSLACDSIPFLPSTPTPTAASTPTETPSPTLTPTATLSPYPTRTASPTLIPGIEEPVPVGDANLLLENVIRRDDFRCGTDSEPIGDPDSKEFLILLLKVVKGPVLSPPQIAKWFRDNDIDQIGIGSSAEDFSAVYDRCFAQNKDTLVLIEIHLAFIVDKQAEGFLLILPDGMQIPLDSFFP
jgi:hypothetical protein